MPVRWVISPVVETVSPDGTRYREPLVGSIADPGRPEWTDDEGQKRPAVLCYTAVISDGLPGQINDWCLCQVVGTDLSGLDTTAGIVDVLEFSHSNAGRDVALQETVDQLGWDNAKLLRVRNKLADKGVDVSKLNRSSKIIDLLRALARRINPNADPANDRTVVVGADGDAALKPRALRSGRPLAGLLANVIFDDEFDGTGGTNITARSPDVGTGWTEVEDTAGTLSIVLTGVSGGSCEVGATSNNNRILCIADPAPSVAEYDIDLHLLIGGGGSNDKTYMLARYIDTSNYYFGEIGCSADNPDHRIGKKVAGTVTSLVTSNSGVTDDVDYLFEIRNATKKLYRSGTELISTSDNALTSAGKGGIAYGNINNAGDDANTNIEISRFRISQAASGTTYTAPTPSGGVAFAGSAARSMQAVIVGSGGIAFSGAAALEAVKEYEAAGSVAFGGAAILEAIKNFVPAGGLAFSGAAATSQEEAGDPVGAIDVHFAESAGETTTTNGGSTWDTKATLTFSPKANTDYIFVWSCLIGGAVNCNVRFRDGAAAADLGVNMESTTGWTPAYTPAGGVARKSMGSSPGSQSFTIDFQSSDGSTQVAIKDARILAIELGATDQFAAVDTETTHNTAFSLEDQTTLTFTPAAGSFLLIFTAEVGNLDAAGHSIISATLDGTDIQGHQTLVTSATSERALWSVASVASLTAASHTMKIRGGSDFTDAVIGRARILALDLSRFEVVQSATNRTDATNTGTFQDFATLNYAPGEADRDHVAFAFQANKNANTADAFGAKIVDAGSDKHLWTQESRHADSWYYWFTAWQLAALPNTTRTIKTQFREAEFSTATADDAVIVAFRLPEAVNEVGNWTAAGGIAFSGAGAVESETSIVGAGGLVLAGHAEVDSIAAVTGAGGIAFFGASLIEMRAAVRGAGGIALAGAAGLQMTQIVEPAGGVAFGGGANTAMKFAGSYLPDGGFVLDGGSDYLVEIVFSPSGGVVFSGSAGTLAPVGHPYNPSGGIELAGAAAIRKEVVFPLSPALFALSGAARVSRVSAAPVEGGGVFFGGSAAIDTTREFAWFGTGPIILGGGEGAAFVFDSAHVHAPPWRTGFLGIEARIGVIEAENRLGAIAEAEDRFEAVAAEQRRAFIGQESRLGLLNQG